MKSNWQIKKLGEIADVRGGGTPPTSNAEYFMGDINWYSPKEIPKEGVAILDQSQKKISESGQRFTTISGVDSVLLTSRATIGTVGILSTASGYSQGIKGIEPGPKLDTWYLAHWLRSNKDELISKASGTTFKEISTSEVKNLEIPLPSLDEQKKIVRSLENILKQIGNAKENTEKNLQNSRELFESYLNILFANYHRGWEKKVFSDICELQRGFDLPTRLRRLGSYPLVSSNGITDHIDVFKVKAPGVVTGRSGTLGKVHYVESNFWPLNTALYVKDFHGNYERLVFYFLVNFDLAKYGSGSGVPTLNRNNVHNIQTYFPTSIQEQKTIVKKLDELSAETKRLEENYNKKILLLEELKKSVLQKAFAGEL